VIVLIPETKPAGPAKARPDDKLRETIRIAAVVLMLTVAASVDRTGWSAPHNDESE
jgi:hypothetical protein